jgi:hypothetical protein
VEVSAFAMFGTAMEAGRDRAAQDRTTRIFIRSIFRVVEEDRRMTVQSGHIDTIRRRKSGDSFSTATILPRCDAGLYVLGWYLSPARVISGESGARFAHSVPEGLVGATVMV